MVSRKNKLWVFSVFFVLFGLFLLGVVLWNKSDVGQVKRLPNGTSVSLRAFVAATNFQYNHKSGGRWVQMLQPVLPKFLLDKFSSGSGGIGFGGDGKTNLFIVTITRGKPSGPSSSIGRLRIWDEDGNSFDAKRGASTLMPGNGETVHGWEVRAWPRRTRNIRLEFLSFSTNGWIHGADFVVTNPLHIEAPQWNAEPWPAAKEDGNLSVELAQFESGAPMEDLKGESPLSTAARKTRMHFAFREKGVPTEGWRVQKVIIEDATGNKWWPYLDLIEQRFNWAKGGTLEFMGALWPGEQAWDLEVESVRTEGFSEDELYEATFSLPGPGSLIELTNVWNGPGFKLAMISMASPGIDHKGDLKWMGKWWGEEPGVYSLVVDLGPEIRGNRLNVVKAQDQKGNEIKILEHRGMDSNSQAIFFKPSESASKVQIQFAVQKSRFVRFRVRPNFVGGVVSAVSE